MSKIPTEISERIIAIALECDGWADERYTLHLAGRKHALVSGGVRPGGDVDVQTEPALAANSMIERHDVVKLALHSKRRKIGRF